MEPPPPPSSLLQRYRRDRRKLLDFIFSPSAGLIKEIRAYAGGPAASISPADFDTLSADYIIDCAQSSGIVDLSEASRRFSDETLYPVMMNSQFGDSYFLVSDPESAGSPPRRSPPLVAVNHSSNHKLQPSDGLGGQKSASPLEEYKVKYAATKQVLKPQKNIIIPSLGLPALRTGLSDDDLRESAYEILLTCMAFYGLEIYSVEYQKKDKSSKFLAGLKNKMDKRHPPSQSPEKHTEVIDTIRVQMQISEAMDACVRQRSMQFASRKACGQLDIPRISLGLLNGIFKTDFLYEKPYIQWKKRQVNTLEELFSSANHFITDKQTIVTLLAKINNSEEWDNLMSPSERTEVLTAIRQFSVLLASVPGRFDIQGETCYWSAGYHLNIRLYEKLLFGIFDILDEGHLIEGADEILKLCKLTWPTLGITQKIHDALYGWVLFQQFVLTEEELLLDQAIFEVQKVLSAEIKMGKDEEYLDSLICFTNCNGTRTELSLVKAIFWEMNFWCDRKLQNYHLHFGQKTGLFRGVMTLALSLKNYNFEENKFTNTSDALSGIAEENVRIYVEQSMEAAYRLVEDTIYFGSQMERTHPLALLASEVRLIAEKELTEFSPILSDWYPEAARVAALLLHQLYGERLKPFLMEVKSLSEEVKLVLPAAGMLEHALIRLFSSAYKENGPQTPSCLELNKYQFGDICRPIILEWVIAQHSRILEWTGRTLNLEEWEPLSHQQKQSSSAVEVFRIIEETVDQFFGLSLPMDITHLQALLSIIFHTLDSYLVNVAGQLVDKHHLYPPVPPLTRYKEAVVFPVIKKKVVEHVLLEEEVISNLNDLTVSKLCIRLNTLQYIQKQIGALEDGIRKSWASATPCEINRDSEVYPEASDNVLESVDELFVATFDSMRDTAADAIRRICDFIGARVVFWDLRDSFLFRLYRGGVGGARFDSVVPHFDTVLNNICGLVDDILRDLVVASICKASLDGYVWVLLDGGPSCAFSDSDISVMEDDLNMLKEFFVADGEGLPRSFVENEARFAHQILDLFSLQTDSVIQMLMTASESIPGFETHNVGSRSLGDAHTLVRVLCHKKDREASKFLKTQYQLPASSDYNDDGPLKDSGSTPPRVADILRSASLRWADNGNSSFRSIKKKFQRATTEIRHTGSPTYS